jgi:signal transduction histidine kinase
VIPIQAAAAVVTVLIVMLGVVHTRMEKRIRTARRLEQMLSEANHELASLEMLKSRFLGRIGDVLAEPLKSIEASSACLSESGKGLPEEFREDLERLHGEVHSLVRILSVFEEIGHQEETGAGSSSRATANISLDGIVSEEAMALAEQAAEKSVSLSVSLCGDVTIAGNPEQMKEAVSSMLFETLRRTAPGGVVTVQLTDSETIQLQTGWTAGENQPVPDENLLGTGLLRLIASSHGGWVSIDAEKRRMTLNLPPAGEGK